MSQNSSSIRVAPNGDILVAPPGSVVPDEVSEDFTADWSILGDLDDGGVELSADKKTGDIGIWQSAAPGKYYVDSASFTAQYNLSQYDANVTRHYYGVEWVAAGASAKLVVPSNPGLDEMMLAVRWIGDNGSTNLAIIERGMVTNRNGIKINRTTGVISGLTFSAMDFNGRLAILLSNDPNILAGLDES